MATLYCRDLFLPPAFRRMREGYVFTPVCPSTWGGGRRRGGGVRAPWSLVPGSFPNLWSFSRGGCTPGLWFQFPFLVPGSFLDRTGVSAGQDRIPLRVEQGTTRAVRLLRSRRRTFLFLDLLLKLMVHMVVIPLL